MDVLAIGKIKNPHVLSLVDDYLVRINRYSPCRIHSLRPSRHRDEARSGHAILEEEGKRFLDAIEPDDFCILLDRVGKPIDSEAFSRLLDQRVNGASKKVAFIVGGFLGVAEAVRRRSDITISLSAMTFPHEIALLLLTEQIYRGFTILNRVAYHK